MVFMSNVVDDLERFLRIRCPEPNEIAPGSSERASVAPATLTAVTAINGKGRLRVVVTNLMVELMVRCRNHENRYMNVWAEMSPSPQLLWRQQVPSNHERGR